MKIIYFFILLERQKDKGEIFWVPIYFQNACKPPDWARPKLGVRDSICLIEVGRPRVRQHLLLLRPHVTGQSRAEAKTKTLAWDAMLSQTVP